MYTIQQDSTVDILLNWLFVLFGAAIIPVTPVMTTNQINEQTLRNRFILRDSRRKTEIGAITVRQHLQTPAGWRGGGGYLATFHRGGSTPRSNPLPLNIPLLTVKIPLSSLLSLLNWKFFPFTNKLLTVTVLVILRRVHAVTRYIGLNCSKDEEGKKPLASKVLFVLNEHQLQRTANEYASKRTI